jgi:N-acylneuraminate cytidylyltransferase
MRLAVIPARGGSKRIPRKNLRPFMGKPIIAYSIEAARRTGLFDRIVVSTEDAEIGEIAAGLGADVPFRRPAALADDHTGIVPVMTHALQWFVEQGVAVEYACCILATAPFLSPLQLRLGFDKLVASDKSFVVSVCSYQFPIQRALRIAPDGVLAPLHPDQILARSQDLEETYHDAGQFYWGRARAFLHGESLLSGASLPAILPRHMVQDIDTPEDWRQAELMYAAYSQTVTDGECR